MPDLDRWKLVVPKLDQERALFECDNTPDSGHLGVDNTYHRVLQSYFWPQMKRDVVRYVKQCVYCQMHEVSQQAPMGLISQGNVEGPWSMVAADIMGPFPPSKGQFRYVLVFQDLFTRYVEIKPLRRATARNIVESLDNLIVFRWGCPKYLVTNGGTEFSNSLMIAGLKELGITKTTVASYHAQASPVERANGALKPMIATFLKRDRRTWDLHLAEFAFAIDTSVQASTQLTPAFLSFGRNPRQAGALKQFGEINQSFEMIDGVAWADGMRRLPAIYDMVQTNLKIANERQAKYFNRNRRNIIFKVGDLVLRRNRVLSLAADHFAAKLAPKFVGPCIVEQVLSPVIYMLRDVNGDKTTKVHVEDLKTYVTPNLQTPTLPGFNHAHGKSWKGQGVQNAQPNSSKTRRGSGSRGPYNLRSRS